MDANPLQPVHRTEAVDYGHSVVVAPHLPPSQWTSGEVGEWIATFALSPSQRKNTSNTFRDIDGERLLSLTDFDLTDLIPNEQVALVLQHELVRLRVRDFIQFDES